MQAAGIFISALTKFSAGVQVCEHQLDRRHFPFRMNIDRNAAAVVAHGHAAIDMHRYFYLVTKSGEMFVDRIVQDFENQVMQTALIRVADVHPGAFADRFQAFELVDLRRVVFLQFIDSREFVLTTFLVRIFVVWFA